MIAHSRACFPEERFFAANDSGETSRCPSPAHPDTACLFAGPRRDACLKPLTPVISEERASHGGTDRARRDATATIVVDRRRVAVHSERRADGCLEALLSPKQTKGDTVLPKNIVTERDADVARVGVAPNDRHQQRDMLRERDVRGSLRKLRLVDSVFCERFSNALQLVATRKPQPQVVVAHVLIRFIETADSAERRGADDSRGIPDEAPAPQELEVRTRACQVDLVEIVLVG